MINSSLCVTGWGYSPIHATVDSKGRPLNFIVTGGQVHDSQVVEEVLDTAKPPLAVTADKAYDSEKVRQQIKDEGALPIIPSRSNAAQKAIVPSTYVGGATRSKTTSAASRIGEASQRATTNLPATSLPSPPWSEHSTRSSCQSGP
jgi:transposase